MPSIRDDRPTTPNYDIDTNAWIGYDAIMLWFKSWFKYPIRTLIASSGVVFGMIFLIGMVTNVLFYRQRVAIKDPLNPMQVGFWVGGSVFTPVVNGLGESINPYVEASFTGKTPIVSPLNNNTRRNSGLRTVPVQNVEESQN